MRHLLEEAFHRTINYLQENDSNRTYHVIAYINPKSGHVFYKQREISSVFESLNEHRQKPYDPNEPASLDPGERYRTFETRFDPFSSGEPVDHDTILKKFHEHLNANGFYHHSTRHPMIHSPREQQFKHWFKRVSSADPEQTPKHERPHHDGSPNMKPTGEPGEQFQGRNRAVWASEHPTRIYDKNYRPGNDRTNKPIPNATRTGHVTVFNDAEVKHAAPDDVDLSNRWFTAATVRRIPEGGIPKNMHPSKLTHNVPRHIKDVQEFFNGVTGRSPEHIERVRREMHEKFPDFVHFIPGNEKNGKGYFVK